MRRKNLTISISLALVAICAGWVSLRYQDDSLELVCRGSKTSGSVSYERQWKGVGTLATSVRFTMPSQGDFDIWNSKKGQLSFPGYSLTPLPEQDVKGRSRYSPILLALSDGRKYRIESASSFEVDVSSRLDPMGEQVRRIYPNFGQTADECPTDEEVAAQKSEAARKLDIAVKEGRLSGLQFTELNIANRNLDSRDLTRLGVQKLAAQNVRLGNADLSSVYFGAGSLERANLQGANLTQAHIRVKLGGANMRSTTLDRANIVGQGDGPDLSSAVGTRAWLVGGLTGAIFNQAILTDSHFQEANLDNSIFDGAVLKGTEFDRVSIKGANLGGALFDNVKWSGVTYDCKTLFPSGFDPLKAGLVKYEACQGEEGIDLSRVTLNVCDDDCFRWLIDNPEGKIRISAQHNTHGLSSKVTVKAGLVERGQCPSRIMYHLRGILGGESEYLKEKLADGFCPQITIDGANSLETLMTSSDWNTTVRDMDQIRISDLHVLRTVIVPRLETYLASGGIYRLSAVRTAIDTIGPEDSGMIKNLTISALSLPTLSDVDVSGGGSSEVNTIMQVVDAVVRIPELTTAAFDALDQNPTLLSSPGYLSLLGAFRSETPYIKSSRGVALNRDRASIYLDRITCSEPREYSLSSVPICALNP
ncbi:pentapeptide repeat-containing protein [Agrobacterium salinitolerans]|nr:pentapeptide repeat-containing protein [Agrobacterium salinitolerans]